MLKFFENEFFCILIVFLFLVSIVVSFVVICVGIVKSKEIISY